MRIWTYNCSSYTIINIVPSASLSKHVGHEACAGKERRAASRSRAHEACAVVHSKERFPDMLVVGLESALGQKLHSRNSVEMRVLELGGVVHGGCALLRVRLYIIGLFLVG